MPWGYAQNRLGVTTLKKCCLLKCNFREMIFIRFIQYNIVNAILQFNRSGQTYTLEHKQTLKQFYSSYVRHLCFQRESQRNF